MGCSTNLGEHDLNENMNIYGLVTISFIGLAGFGIIFLNIDFSDVIIGAILTAIGLGAYAIVNKDLKTDLIRRNASTKKSGPKLSFEDCKKIAKGFGENNLGSPKDRISFDWTLSKSEPVPILDPKSREWLYVRHFYTKHGPSNRAVNIFVDATNGDPDASPPKGVYAIQPVQGSKRKKYHPFKFLEAYKLTRRLIRSGRFNLDEEQDQRFVDGEGIAPANFYIQGGESEQ